MKWLVVAGRERPCHRACSVATTVSEARMLATFLFYTSLRFSEINILFKVTYNLDVAKRQVSMPWRAECRDESTSHKATEMTLT